MINTDGIELSGWLRKSPPERKLRRNAWKKRWFVLRSGRLSGEPNVLEYYRNQTSKKPKRSISLDQCIQIDTNVPVKYEGKSNLNHHVFDIVTKTRTYYLVAESPLEMASWVSRLCKLCGFYHDSTEHGLDNQDQKTYKPDPGIMAHQNGSASAALLPNNYNQQQNTRSPTTTAAAANQSDQRVVTSQPPSSRVNGCAAAAGDNDATTTTVGNGPSPASIDPAKNRYSSGTGASAVNGGTTQHMDDNREYVLLNECESVDITSTSSILSSSQQRMEQRNSIDSVFTHDKQETAANNKLQMNISQQPPLYTNSSLLHNKKERLGSMPKCPPPAPPNASGALYNNLASRMTSSNPISPHSAVLEDNHIYVNEDDDEVFEPSGSVPLQRKQQQQQSPHVHMSNGESATPSRIDQEHHRHQAVVPATVPTAAIMMNTPANWRHFNKIMPTESPPTTATIYQQSPHFSNISSGGIVTSVAAASVGSYSVGSPLNSTMFPFIPASCNIQPCNEYVNTADAVTAVYGVQSGGGQEQFSPASTRNTQGSSSSSCISPALAKQQHHHQLAKMPSPLAIVELAPLIPPHQPTNNISRSFNNMHIMHPPHHPVHHPNHPSTGGKHYINTTLVINPPPPMMPHVSHVRRSSSVGQLELIPTSELISASMMGATTVTSPQRRRSIDDKFPSFRGGAAGLDVITASRMTPPPRPPKPPQVRSYSPPHADIVFDTVASEADNDDCDRVVDIMARRKGNKSCSSTGSNSKTSFVNMRAAAAIAIVAPSSLPDKSPVQMMYPVGGGQVVQPVTTHNYYAFPHHPDGDSGLNPNPYEDMKPQYVMNDHLEAGGLYQPMNGCSTIIIEGNNMRGANPPPVPRDKKPFYSSNSTTSLYGGGFSPINTSFNDTASMSSGSMTPRPRPPPQIPTRPGKSGSEQSISPGTPMMSTTVPRRGQGGQMRQQQANPIPPTPGQSPNPTYSNGAGTTVITNEINYEVVFPVHHHQGTPVPPPDPRNHPTSDDDTVQYAIIDQDLTRNLETTKKIRNNENEMKTLKRDPKTLPRR